MMTKSLDGQAFRKAGQSNHTNLNPDHNTIQQVTNADYDGMHKEAII
jgi:hypothetical protein